MTTTEQVTATLRTRGIAVDANLTQTLADEASDREEQMTRLWSYDLTGVDSAVEVTRRGRR